MPPPVPRESPRRPAPVAWYAAAAGVILAGFVARTMVDGRLLYPGCGFRWMTSRPCPGCGGTHALAALADGDPAAALAGNPLVAMLAFAGLGLGLLAAVDQLVNRGRLVPLLHSRMRRAKRAGWLILTAVLVNWAYLLHVVE